MQRGPDITIRAAAPEEYGRAYGVIRETLQYHVAIVPERFRDSESPGPSRDVVADLVKTGTGAIFHAEQGHVIGAFLVVRLLVPGVSFLTAETLATVDALGVTQEWRGRGVGRRLMEAAERWAAEHSAIRMILSVWEANHGARTFYEKLGYATAYRNLWR
jgi:GNAT superfamily N-acetyltransferase